MGAAEPGDLLAGRYRLRHVLGRGGMGVVWLADDELLHREVAVKEILWPPQLDAKEREGLRQRALREARTAARLNHPNIIGVYDVVEDDGRPWIVMQLARYRSLSDVVRDDGPLPAGRAARIGLQLLAAIRAAHLAGVLHRDVKPGNVLLGPDDHVVLTDFGMAVADGSPALTTSGVLIGSPSYMAPERARGEPGTPAADLWSLGATLYTAVEGRPPFERESPIAVLTAVVSADPGPPRRAGPLRPVISGLLRKDPAQRLNAAEAEDMLRRATDQPGPGNATAERTAPLGGFAAVIGDGEAGGHPLPAAPGTRTLPQRPAPAPGARRETAYPAGPPPGPRGPARAPSPPPGPAGAPPGGRRARSRWLFAAGAGLAVVAVAIIVAFSLASAHPLGHQAAPPGQRGSPPAARNKARAGRHPRRHGASPPARPGSSAPARPGTASPGPGHPGTGALPAGFTRYHDPTGFSIGMPEGWQVFHRGHLVYIQDPGSARFLIIDQTTHPRPNPLTDWRQQEAARRGTYPGYHRIRLQAVHYPQAESAADWEFTYYSNGQLTHVLNRNILVSSRHAYALYWSTPASQWSASYHYFRAFAATFRPVGSPGRGS